MHDTSTEAVLKWMSGEASPEAIAAEHGVTVAELERWRALFIAGARTSQPRRDRRRALLAAAFITAGALGLVGREAWAATCTQTLPSPLTTFCVDSPAIASQVNGNFQGVLDEVRNKVGAYGSANVVVGNGAATATLTVPGATTLNGALTANGTTSLRNTTVNGNAAVTGSLAMNTTRKSCASSPCHCNTAQQFPIAWSATCANSGVALYSANVVQDVGGNWGYDVKCINSNFTSTPNALAVTLYCAPLALNVQ